MLSINSIWAISPAVAQEDSQSVGLENEKPKSGPFVAMKEGGYMVPYEATIPGTQVKYWMVPVPGGKFTMGSPAKEKDRNQDEGPQFEVTIEPFWMSKYELTWNEFQTFMKLSGALQQLQRKKKMRIAKPNADIDAVASPSALYDPSFTLTPGEGLDQPAATMTQFSAMQYTKWLSLISTRFYRLPTESEWEYACRAGTKTAYHFGDDPKDLKKYAWFDDDDLERHAVGKLLPNQFGLYDMHGNVAEWVLDGYNKNGYKHIREGESLSATEAYFHPKKKHKRVARGGSFESAAEECRSASRLGATKDWAMEDPGFPKSPWWYTDSPSSGVGFRIVRPLDPPKELDEKNKFWSNPKRFRDAVERFENSGRGAIAPVDPDLPGELNQLKSELDKLKKSKK